jgi:hypothetical protein
MPKPAPNLANAIKDQRHLSNYFSRIKTSKRSDFIKMNNKDGSRRKRTVVIKETNGPDVSWHKDDDRDGAKPGITDGEQHVARHVGSSEVAERHGDHAQRQRQRNQVKHPHRQIKSERSDRIGCYVTERGSLRKKEGEKEGGDGGKRVELLVVGIISGRDKPTFLDLRRLTDPFGSVFNSASVYSVRSN